MADRKIRLESNSWVNRCPEQLVFDADTGVEVRFFDMFEPPVIDRFENETEHVVEGRTRLDLLAKEHYGDRSLDWVIAVRNGLDLPDAELYEGMVLMIPEDNYVKGTLLRDYGV